MGASTKVEAGPDQETAQEHSQDQAERATVTRHAPPTHPLLDLQRSAGNRFVHNRLMRQSADAMEPEPGPATEAALERAGQGSPLPNKLRARMEEALGTELSSVRVHTDETASSAAIELHARAFAHRRDIFFGESQFQPGTLEGDRLLAHEIVHTVQQSDPGNSGAMVSRHAEVGPTDGLLEQEAEAVANSLNRGNQGISNMIELSAAPARPVLQRDWFDPIASGFQWAGEKAASGAQWAGGKIASGAESTWEGAKWLAGKSVAEARRIVAAARECAKATGRSVSDILSLNFTSITDILDFRVTGSENAPSLLDKMLQLVQHPCVQMIPGYSLLTDAVERLSSVRDFLKGAWRVMQNPGVVLDAMYAALDNLMAQIPGRAREQTRAAITFSEPQEDHLAGVWRHLSPKLEYLAANWWDVIKQTAWDLLWPWPGVWSDLTEIWAHIRSAANNVRDLNFNAAVDDLLAVWRTANSAIAHLYGWFFIGSVLVGAIIGAFFGGAGAIPGAGLGATFALKVGQGMLISMIAAETASLLKAGFNLTQTSQTPEEQEESYEQIASSGLALAIVGSMFALGAIAVRFARGILARVRGLFRRRATGTVWDSIVPTQPPYPGTAIPRSFTMTTQNGRFWVHGNVTEHLAERALANLARGVPSRAVNVSTQAQLTSLQAAIGTAARQGIQYGQMIRVGNWELIFAAPRQSGQFPALIHGLYR